jgi:hypothetical protein
LAIKKEVWAEYLKESISYPEGTAFPFYKPQHVLVPITYITPNYFSIRTLAITSALTNLGHTVSLLIHDNNIVAHKYIASNKLMRQRTISGGYPGYLIEEIWRLQNKSYKIIRHMAQPHERYILVSRVLFHACKTQALERRADA